MPESFRMDKFCKKVFSVPGGTTSKPSGLARSEAILATNLFVAKPTVETRPDTCFTASLTLAPLSFQSLKSRSQPVKSKKASSTETCSTMGATDFSCSKIAEDIFEYSEKLCSTNM